MSEQIEGRNAVLEAFRSGKCVDKLFVLDRCQDGPVRTIIRNRTGTILLQNHMDHSAFVPSNTPSETMIFASSLPVT